MRKAVNDNQTVQVVLIGILVIVAGYLFMTRIAGGSSSEGTTAPPAPTTTPADTSGSESAAPSTEAESKPSESTSGTSSPGKGSDASANASEADAAGAEGFVSGPGLPEPVVKEYDDGSTVVLLVVRRHGIDDRKVEAAVRKQAGAGDTAVFVSRAKEIAKYSRIAQGVEIDRVPALVVIEPKRLAGGALPTATVSYGYRGPESIAQAVRDAVYKGRDNLPYYPN